MKRLSVILTSLLMLGGLAMLVAPAASATVTCPPNIIGTTVNDNVNVASGYCLIYNATINGNVTVQPGASLDIEGSTINGSISATSPSGIFIGCVNNGSACTRQSQLNGSVSITGLTGNSSYICETVINGPLSVTNNVSGSVIEIGRRRVDTPQFGGNQCAFQGTNTIAGAVTVTGNAGRVDFWNNVVYAGGTFSNNSGGGSVAHNTFYGDLTITKNCPPYTPVTPNTVYGTSNINQTCVVYG